MDGTKLREAVEASLSYRDVCRYLGVKEIGGSYRRVRNRIITLDLDISHFNPFARFGHISFNKIPIEDILVEDSTYNSSALRKRLIKEGHKEERCERCGQEPTWNDELLSLQLHHKNGVSDDHRLENLEILCPNCHSQTKTFTSKNIGGVSRESTGYRLRS